MDEVARFAKILIKAFKIGTEEMDRIDKMNRIVKSGILSDSIRLILSILSKCFVV